jgi:Haemolysin-III related
MNHKKSEDVIMEKYNGQPVLGSYKEAPSFQKDNEYILNGYRLNHNKFSRVIKSLFTIHNETINIWSHLVGVAIFMFLMSYIAVNFTQKIIPTLKTVNVSSLNEYVEDLLIDTYHYTYNALSYVWGKIHDFPAYLFSSNEESFRIIQSLPKCKLITQGHFMSI